MVSPDNWWKILLGGQKKNVVYAGKLVVCTAKDGNVRVEIPSVRGGGGCGLWCSSCVLHVVKLFDSCPAASKRGLGCT